MNWPHEKVESAATAVIVNLERSGLAEVDGQEIILLIRAPDLHEPSHDEQLTREQDMSRFRDIEEFEDRRIIGIQPEQHLASGLGDV